MSIIIKGMDMPKDCFECPFKVSNGIISGKRMEFECVANGYTTLDDYQYDDKPSNCPLIEIDLVRCEECKYQYMCGHQINRHGLTLKLTCCEYGERSKK